MTRGGMHLSLTSAGPDKSFMDVLAHRDLNLSFIFLIIQMSVFGCRFKVEIFCVFHAPNCLKLKAGKQRRSTVADDSKMCSLKYILW